MVDMDRKTLLEDYPLPQSEEEKSSMTKTAFLGFILLAIASVALTLLFM